MKKNNEIMKYLFFGILTTFVSFGTYYILVLTVFEPTIPIQLQITNIISWITSVTFAYFVNKNYVFEGKNNNSLKMIIHFYVSRIFALTLDMMLMFWFVSLLKFDDKIVKLFIQVVVIILNYFLSKFVVFKGSE